MRKSRSNGTATYTYTYNGGKLTQMVKGSDTLYFTYDAFGAPWTVKWNGTVYNYMTNLQGDVIAIVNTSNVAVVEYVYDAWGNILSISGTMATTLGTLNPLTYRGYVYDHETEFYYLQSRYYNPEWGRFLNADAFVSTGGLLGNNMFAYCGNNPVNFCDPGGNSFGAAFAPIFEIVDAIGEVFIELTLPILLNSEISEEEMDYAAVIYTEAAGQNLITKRAIASVIHNRVGHRSSWKTIQDVISTPHQFSGYGNSMYIDAKNYYTSGTHDNKIEREAMNQCLFMAVYTYHGYFKDITGGSLYFHSLPNPEDWKYHSAYKQIYVFGTEKF